MGIPEAKWAAVATGLFAIGGGAQLAGAPASVYWTLYLACYVAGGWEPALSGLQALRNRIFDVDVLMVLAAIGAAAIGQIFDGALLIIIFATSGALEAIAIRRTEQSVSELLDIAPSTTIRIDGDEECLVNTAQLVPGDIIRVRPGERIGADGVVVAGTSEVDQSTITGESLSVAKELGDQVFAATMNGTGALQIKVTHDPQQSVVARIVAMVAQASQTKAATALFIEKVEQRYSMAVAAATVVLFGTALILGSPFSAALLRAMTFMVVASPCAIVLATMPPLLSAIANAGRHGLLVKSAVVMEQLGQIDHVAFDKTGTLTDGHMQITGIHPQPGIDDDELLTWAATAESPSEHPLAVAIVSAARDRGLPLGNCEDFTAISGRGVRARVDGRTVEVSGPQREPILQIQRIHDVGQTAVVVRVEQADIGVIAVADQPRAGAKFVATALHESSMEVSLLTGDNLGAAHKIADSAGITDTAANLLPIDKAACVVRQQQSGRRVLFVGDGINDAPALTTADVGMAMGRRGSDLALQTADAVLVRDDLAAIPAVLELARRARRVVQANLIFAACVIIGLVAWDLIGTLPLPLGVAGHELSTVIVGLNGLRLLRNRAWHQEPHLLDQLSPSLRPSRQLPTTNRTVF